MLHKYFGTEYSAFKQYSFHTSIYILVTFYIRTLDTCKKRGFPILKAIYKFEISFEGKNKHGFVHNFQRLEVRIFFFTSKVFQYRRILLVNEFDIPQQNFDRGETIWKPIIQGVTNFWTTIKNGAMNHNVNIFACTKCI